MLNNNIYINLLRQFERHFKHNRQDSIKTRHRYRAAFLRFLVFLAEFFRLEKLANLAPKHVYSYVNYLIERGASVAYIKLELSAIRFWHDKLSERRYDKLPTNEQLGLDRRTYGGVDRTWSMGEFPLLMDGVKNGTYELVLLPFCPEDSELQCIKFGEEHLSFLLPKRHRLAKRKSLSVSEMNGENMLLFQEIGFWHDLVLDKMPDSRFLMQTERYTFLELIENSSMPVFTTDAYQGPESHDRVSVPITDPEFNVTYYLVFKRENKKQYELLMK